ncbi:MAG TPA: cytochrome c peroxidase, partial [Candidatus Krumholzibacteria bacterium]|nr:cytochrome c peroxidase [Candidatus Krumholzibacteria bacterium]
FADGRRLGAGVGGAQFDDLDLGPSRVVPGISLVTGDPVGTEPRNSMTILNAAFNGKDSITPLADSFQFMDGRVTDGLEGQAILPLTSREEMAGDAYGPSATVQDAQDAVTQRIRAIPEYVMRFRQAFAGEINEASDITIQHIGRAIAAYERELITPNSRYDQFVSGDYGVFTQQEKLGFKLFFGKGVCGDCHRGPMLSDFEFVVQGVGEDYDSIMPGFLGKNGLGGDFGRFHADEVAFADQKFAFRTLTIRNVELTAPYFHSGSAGTLMEVLEFYNRGGRGPQDISDTEMAAAGVVRDASIHPLDLSQEEMEAIVAFLKTTTAPVQTASLGINLTEVPQRVPSGLVPPGIPTPEGAGPFLTAHQEARY